MKTISALAVGLAVTMVAPEVLAKAKASEQEKCYGIVKAEMNDCATSTASCAGSATKDKQPDAFIFLPKGVCDKIVGGSLTPKKDGK